ncbi:9732_t:CDS:2, partial [Funneliformis geosporum]
LDLIAYTSTLKIGVSYTNPKFERAFCLFNSYIETNAGNNQMLFHMQCIKDYICHIEQRSSNNRGIFPDIDSVIQNKDVLTIRLWVAFILEKFQPIPKSEENVVSLSQ